MRPLLKWAGGKRQLLETLRPYYPATFTRYIEPFVGSGAVFFDLYSSGRLSGRRVWLVDDNPDLIGCYLMLRDRIEEVIAALDALARGHDAGRDAFYYDVRDKRFNPLRAGQASGAGRASGAYTPELAAMLIYLNRTGFNGLFRLNQRGEFNVPVGRYANPRILDEQHLRSVAAALRSPGVTIERASFEDVLSDAGAGDFVYCDPPYAPMSRTACFANYTASGFSGSDQQRLHEAVVAAARRGAAIVLSNSFTSEIKALYADRAARDAGLALHRVSARRAINSRASLRGPVDELIITNVRKRLELDVGRPRMLPARPRQKRQTA